MCRQELLDGMSKRDKWNRMDGWEDEIDEIGRWDKMVELDGMGG